MFLNLKKKFNLKFLKRIKTRRSKERFGRFAELIAALWLQLHGYKILKRRFKNPLGEVDLIAKRGSTLIFIEVKARQNLDQGLEALTLFQQQRIKNGARFYLAKHQINSFQDVRFDYIILIKSKIYHLKNAF